MNISPAKFSMFIVQCSIVIFVSSLRPELISSERFNRPAHFIECGEPAVYGNDLVNVETEALQ